MTFKELIQGIERIAGAQPAVRTLIPNDIFRLNEDPAVRFGAFCVSAGRASQSRTGEQITYSFTLYYADRLTDDKENTRDVQSTAIDVITNVINGIREELRAEVASVGIQPFTQRFAQMCAGAYAEIQVTTNAAYPCYFPYIASV